MAIFRISMPDDRAGAEDIVNRMACFFETDIAFDAGAFFNTLRGPGPNDFFARVWKPHYEFSLSRVGTRF
jgi:hypothetical protein